MIDRSRVLWLLFNWARFADRWWYDLPGHAGLGCFGTGYNAWGVQTNQKYLAAMAVLANEEHALSRRDCDWARARALASLRFSLASHVSGPLACTDGTKWGHTWISALGIERMMHGVRLLTPHLDDADRVALHRVIASECDWLATDYKRGPHAGVQADKWAHTGKNDPESNLWNGSLLWRGATLMPDHPNADAWREQALRFLANGASIDADARDDTVYDGKPLRERHVGASFFDSFALDHHGYLNVGYMVICASHAAILHFDQRIAGLPTPELLHLHQKELWRTIRAMTFDDGRLARIGGDSRVRYAYCQEYLLPCLFYACDHLGDRDVERRANGILDLCEIESSANGDGSFYGKRLAWMRDQSPYYYTRLEGDRASGLSMALTYAPHVKPNDAPTMEPITLWSEPEHGAAVHRSATRFASFAWRAYGLTQGMCLPPDASDLAEWEFNCAGEIRFVHHPHANSPTGPFHRKLIRHHLQTFPGGFATSGAVSEGVNIHLAEGWSANDLATHHLAFVALPDDHTVVGLQFCRTRNLRTLVTSVKGLRLNVPNDLFNRFRRVTQTGGEERVVSRQAVTMVRQLRWRWACIEGKVGVVALYGADNISIDLSTAQRSGPVPSLKVDQYCVHHRTGPWFADPESVLLDCAWLVSASTDAAQTESLATANASARVACDHPDARVLRIVDVNGRSHTIAFNVSDSPIAIRVEQRDITLAPSEAGLVDS